MRYDNFNEFEQEFIKQNPHITILPMYYKHRESYRPWYDSNADYNTNAKSYYDYLGRFNGEISSIIDMLNRAMRRNIEVVDTESIDLTKLGDWISEDDCHNYSDVIKLQADIILSEQKLKYQFDLLKVKEYELKNVLKVLNDGVYAPDFTDVLKQISKEIDQIWKEIDVINAHIKNLGDEINNIKKELQTINNNITNIQNGNKKTDKALQQIIDNLYKTGAINNNTFDFTFNSGRDFATGNINFFGGAMYGNSFIRTNKATAQKPNENDVASGV